MNRQPSRRTRPLVEEFEPRILYSADAASALLTQALLPSAEVRSLDAYFANQQHAAIAAPVEQRGAEIAQATPAREIVFIDSRVPDPMRLAAELMEQRGDGRQFDLVTLNADEDGVAQINRVLAGEHGLAAIHIISHGSDGAIEIGGTRLDVAASRSTPTPWRSGAMRSPPTATCCCMAATWRRARRGAPSSRT